MGIGQGQAGHVVIPWGHVSGRTPFVFSFYRVLCFDFSSSYPLSSCRYLLNPVRSYHFVKGILVAVPRVDATQPMDSVGAFNHGSPGFRGGSR